MISNKLSKTQLSVITGKDIKTINKRIVGLIPEDSDDKREMLYDSREALSRIYLADFQPNKKDVLLIEEIRHEIAKADKAELEVQRLRREYIPIEDVVKDVEQEYNFIRNKLKSLGNRLAQRLSVIDDPHQIKFEIDEEVNNCLIELNSDERYKEIEHEVSKIRTSKDSPESSETETDSESS